MGRLLVALGQGVGVSPSSFAAAWDDDEEAHSMGSATVDTPVRGVFLADVLALVVIPLLVNVGSNTVYDLVRRLVAKARSPQTDQPDLELVEVENNNGDRIVVVRVRGARP
jgi:hypothetical protein